MADQKISELTAATSGASADLLHVVQGGTNKKLTVANLFAGIDTNVKLDGFLALEGTAQAITAAGMGCQAAIDCERWLEDNIH